MSRLKMTWEEFPKLELKKFYAVTKPVEAELWGYRDPYEDEEED